MFFKKRTEPHLMVIGIDGVPYELIKNFSESGNMPNARKLIEKYGLIKTQVPMPEISSVSWTSFMTGMNPGENNVFGFMELNPNTYTYIFPSFKTLPVRTIWENLGEKGKRSIIINLPGTYPARPLKGILVSGFVALDLERAVFPISLLAQLKKIDYVVDADASKAAENKAQFLQSLHRTLDIRYELYKKLEKKEPWDLFFFIITETDRLHHFFFDAVDNPESPYYNDFIRFYEKIDHILGEITRSMEKRGIPFIILSDHGFTKIKKEVYISQYLKEWGYLDCLDSAPKSLESLTPNTKVFALDPSRLYVHLAEKYKRARVSGSEYQPLREEIKERFLNLRIDGEQVIRNVFFKEEIYNGPYLSNAPDVVLLSNYGYDLKSGITKTVLHQKTFFEGMHTQDNALLIDACGLQSKDHPFIYDIGKQIQHYFN